MILYGRFVVKINGLSMVPPQKSLWRSYSAELGTYNILIRLSIWNTVTRTHKYLFTENLPQAHMEIHGQEFSDVLFLLLFSSTLKAHLVKHLATSGWSRRLCECNQEDLLPMELAPGTVVLKGHFDLLVGVQPVPSSLYCVGRQGKLISVSHVATECLHCCHPPLPGPTPLLPQPFLSVCLSVQLAYSQKYYFLMN